MGNKNELLLKLDEKYQKFSKGQKKLADFIRDLDRELFLAVIADNADQLGAFVVVDNVGGVDRRGAIHPHIEGRIVDV